MITMFLGAGKGGGLIASASMVIGYKKSREMKYHFTFADASTHAKIFDYNTDAEPPHVGELVQLSMISEGKVDDTYRVARVYHVPESEDLTGVVIEIEVVK